LHKKRFSYLCVENYKTKVVNKLFVTLMVAVAVLSSCKSPKMITYAKGAGEPVSYTENLQKEFPEELVKVGDYLMITVSTSSPESSLPFNPPIVPDPSQMGGASKSIYSQASLQSYLVDAKGEITFPVVGKLKVAGLSKLQIQQLVKSQIFPKYLTEDPMVVVRFIDYTISVLGEVNRPGTMSVPSERITIYDALAAAGDLTIYGQRNNVLLVRLDEKGERKTYRLDLTNKDLISSSFYFLKKNDVLYVQPNKVKARGASIGSAETLTLSIVGILISFTSLIATLTR